MCENTGWQTPSWLTNSYLENVLKKYLNDNNVKITNFDIKPSTENGENYCSIMVRITLEFVQENVNKKLSFILKYSHETDPFTANVLSGYDVYNTEMKMYERVLPQISNILQEIKDPEKLFAKTLNVDFENSAIIFEDLSKQNYVLANRLNGMDEQHGRLVMKKLAKFHAAAAILNQRLNGELESFQRGLFNKHTRAVGCLYEYLIENCAKFAMNCPELGSYYHDKLMKLKPHIVDYGLRAYNSSPSHFNTLCHGDLWTNNMMMLYNETTTKAKELKDVLFIDFQLSNWSSPAVDLYYFLYTSLESELQLDIHAINKLIQYYHGILVDVLTKLNYKGQIPTLHQLHIQLEGEKILALTATTVNQAVMINDQCDDADFRALLEDNERGRKFRNILYQNKRLQTILKGLLPFYDQIGVLDVQK